MDDLISRQDAYKVLTDYYHHKTEIQHIGLKEALNRVPSAQPTQLNTPNTLDALDCISRKDAIDSVQGIGRLATLPDNDAVIRMSAVEYVLYNLPFAQPEIIRCKDCKWFGKAGCAVEIVDDSDKPTEDDYCSFAERRTDD